MLELHAALDALGHLRRSGLGLLLRGVRESARVNNAMVVVKLLVLGVFCVVGGMHIDPDNFTPFAPNGFTGIHQGAAIVFFAYIGFDIVATTSEEARNPQRDIPIGIFASLGICTVLYILASIVFTGLRPYKELATAAPAATALST